MPAPVVLPPLEQHHSPNQSGRRGVVPFLVVVHRPVGSYASALRTLTSPAVKASAHILTDSNRRAAQLVPWNRKAWSCVAFNSSSYNIEVDDNAWNGHDRAALHTAARIVAFICHETRIPPHWTRLPHSEPGVTRHFDLGRAGGGHTDPTTSTPIWEHFMELVLAEHRRGGFRRSWGVGTLARIDL